VVRGIHSTLAESFKLQFYPPVADSAKGSPSARNLSATLRRVAVKTSAFDHSIPPSAGSVFSLRQFACASRRDRPPLHRGIVNREIHSIQPAKFQTLESS